MEITMPATYTEAHNIDGGAYSLARMWVDAPVRDGSAERELGELAVMSALADWLTRWLPMHIHGAALTGADLGQIAEATGMDRVRVREVWRKWADGQRYLYDQRYEPADTGIGFSVEDYNSAAAVLGCPSWPAS